MPGEGQGRGRKEEGGRRVETGREEEGGGRERKEEGGRRKGGRKEGRRGEG